MDLLFYIIIFLILLLSEAFFSGSEIALIAANPQKIRKSSSVSPARIKMTLDLLKDRKYLFSPFTIQRKRRSLCGHHAFPPLTHLW